MVYEIKNLQNFQDLLQAGQNQIKLIVVDFYAEWCGPCKIVAPQYEQLAAAYNCNSADSSVYLAKVNVDADQGQIAQCENIRAMPTFKGYFNCECVFTMTGANLDKLRREIQIYAELPASLKRVIRANKKAAWQTTLDTLSRIIHNVLEHPHEDKYRHLKLTNKIVTESLLEVDGAMELLFHLGFEEDEEQFSLPTKPGEAIKLNTLLSQIKCVQNYREIALDSECKLPDAARTGAVTSSSASVTPLQSNSASSSISNSSSSSMTARQTDIQSRMFLYQAQPFLADLLRQRSRISAYLSKELQDRAAQLCQMEQMFEEAERDSKKFVQRLVRWFKYEFFSWFEPRRCTACSQPLRLVSTHVCDGERVESYACVCSGGGAAANAAVNRQEFTRHNNLSKLLHTRTGRCGEWANCFALFLSAALSRRFIRGARWVFDSTDHVWCEFVCLDRGGDGGGDNLTDSDIDWIHVDPCEAAIDKPLLYEVGWGKKLEYVIAFTIGLWVTSSSPSSPSSSSLLAETSAMQDVTWRYVVDPLKVTLPRRNLVPEALLVQFLLDHYWLLTAKESNAQFDLRRMSELTKMVYLSSTLSSSSSSGKDHDKSVCVWRFDRQNQTAANEGAALPGRTTGSVEWRAQRGELGALTAAATTNSSNSSSQSQQGDGSGFVIRPTAQEMANGRLRLSYNCATDRYERNPNIAAAAAAAGGGGGGGAERRRSSASQQQLGPMKLSHDTDNWQRLANAHENVARKVEYDWDIVYLARREGETADKPGRVEWRFDVRAGRGEEIEDAQKESESEAARNTIEIGEVNVFCTQAEYESGRVAWRLSWGGGAQTSRQEKTHADAGEKREAGEEGEREQGSAQVRGMLSTKETLGSKWLSLSVELKGGTGSVGWQQAQLFRQKTNDFGNNVFTIDVELKKSLGSASTSSESSSGVSASPPPPPKS